MPLVLYRSDRKKQLFKVPKREGGVYIQNMPNTLCHIAIQGPLCRFMLPPSSFAWILLGCVLPDLPWILLHLLRPLALFDPYSLRLYCTVQASLFFCALLAGAIALTACRTKTVFLILLVNCLLHLLLDALQIKWGNGVNLLAPFDWHFFTAALLWPENLATRALTVFGLFYLFTTWHNAARAVRLEYRLRLPRGKKRLLAILLLALWCCSPPLFFSALDRADTFALHTLRMVAQRPGKNISFDRVPYNAETREITIFTGERLKIIGSLPDHSGRVSFRGFFTDQQTIRSTAFHSHDNFRDLASKTGLLLTCLFLCHSLLLVPVFHHKPRP